MKHVDAVATNQKCLKCSWKGKCPLAYNFFVFCPKTKPKEKLQVTNDIKGKLFTQFAN